MSKLFRIREYPGKGRGIEAKIDLAAGTVLVRTPVLVLPEGDVAGSTNSLLSRYVFHWEDNSVAVALGIASLFNHSDKSNCSYEPDHAAKTVVVTLSQDVSAGTELTIDYGWTEDGFLEAARMSNANPLGAALLAAALATRQQPETAAKDGDLRLRVLNNPKAHKMAVNMYRDLISDTDHSHYASFLKALDDLLFKFRGDQPLTEEEQEEMDKHLGDDKDDGKGKKG